MLVRRRGRLDAWPDGVAKTGLARRDGKSVGIEVRDTAPGLGGQVDGGRLLMRDVRVASLLVGDARDRAMARLFGVSRDQAGLLTLVIALMLAQAVHDKVESLLKPGGPPTMSDGHAGSRIAARARVGRCTTGFPRPLHVECPHARPGGGDRPGRLP